MYIIAIKLFTSSSRSQKAELNTKKLKSETGDFPDIFTSLIKTKHIHNMKFFNGVNDKINVLHSSPHIFHCDY